MTYYIIMYYIMFDHITLHYVISIIVLKSSNRSLFVRGRLFALYSAAVTYIHLTGKATCRALQREKQRMQMTRLCCLLFHPANRVSSVRTLESVLHPSQPDVPPSGSTGHPASLELTDTHFSCPMTLKSEPAPLSGASHRGRHLFGGEWRKLICTFCTPEERTI